MKSRPVSLALVAVLVMAHAIAMTVTAPPAEASAEVSLVCFPHAPAENLYHNSWGSARSGGRRHTGTDIMSPKGIEVRAVADGVVATLGDGPRAGYYVRIAHADGWESWYLHLNNDTPGSDDGRGGAETAYVAGLGVGDVVSAGDVIGYVGDSGNAEWTGSHTHFELHIDGRPVNPYDYLVDVERRTQDALDLARALVILPAHEVDEAATGQLWGALIATPGIECLPDAYKNAIKHLFGQLPGRSVQLTGVIAR